ncbi:type IV secretory system conjugative DNA transfer family protein [Actinomadura montaniterrae]|uniref:type IV secretory system conjugative DNA transfer family protein n=1 Tax=Actinomadura montaniterrae TaxID=1803903 RepID=UPI00178C4C3E|nr:TraM recognition domain-containing protein [Actinomadura montaniterrae]
MRDDERTPSRTGSAGLRARWSGGTMYAAAGAPLLPLAGPLHDLARLGPVAPALGAGVVAAAAAAGAMQRFGSGGQRRRRRGRSLSPRTRAKMRLRPGHGFATRGQLYRQYGRWPARRIARYGRPSLSRRDRWFGQWPEYAALHGRAQGLLHRWGVYSTFEDLVLFIAPPQEGKSQHAAASIVRAPGPVVVTSIRGDLIRDTAGLRQQRGYTWIFNPEGVGSYAGNMRWNPVAGCEDVMTAVRRAGYMVEASEARGLSDAAFWEDMASMTLASFMHAAALMGGNMSNVYTWIMDPGEAEHPIYVLSDHRQAAPVTLQVLRHLYAMPDKTREGVITTLSRVLRFMIHPEMTQILCPQVGGAFDFAEFLRSKDTVYLVSSTDGTAPTAPVFSAFLAELAAVSNQLGNKYKTTDGRVISRLDPPLTIVGDELGNTAPIPVDQWASWSAGSGIVIFMYFQTWSRIQERWGHHGAEALWGSSKMKIIGAGVTETAVLERMSKLIGKTDVREPDEITYDSRGRQVKRPRWTEVDIAPVADIRAIPSGKALVLRSTASAPTIITLTALRRLREFKRWVKAGRPVEGLVDVPERELPTVRPELAVPRPAPAPEPVIDEVSARRARRPSAAPPLPLPPRGPAEPPRPAPPRPVPAPAEPVEPPAAPPVPSPWSTISTPAPFGDATDAGDVETGEQDGADAIPPGFSPFHRRVGGA